MAITFSLSPDGEVINDQHLIAEVLREALPYIDFLKGKTLVIKLGGSTLEHQRGILQDIIWLRALGANTVLVHGGGPYINEWLNKLNLPTHFENGLSVTDGNMVRARVADERLGFVGEIETVDPTLVQTLMAQAYIPIIAPLGQG